MAYRRADLHARMGILFRHANYNEQPDGRRVHRRRLLSLLASDPARRWASSFLSMEDETGISNIVIHPKLYERERVLVTRGPSS